MQVIMFMIIVQYAVLGKRVEVLMRGNLSLTLICERMLENVASVMQVWLRLCQSESLTQTHTETHKDT